MVVGHGSEFKRSIQPEDIVEKAVDAGLAASIGNALSRLGPLTPGLYVVATPIGHLGDISLRALHVLAASDLVLCEDTRITARLMERYRLSPRLHSYHDHNAAARRPKIMAKLAEGAVVALVSDAGTPLVSDPGYRLVRAAIAGGHAVHAIPGPSAVLAGLVVSGLPTDRFWFEGFLPNKAAARRARITELAQLDGTLVFFESPRRAAATLADLAETLGARNAVLARELTKRHETILRGVLPQLAQELAEASAPKGEVVIVVAPPGAEAHAAPDDAEVDRRLAELTAELGTKEAAARLAAETGLRRRDLYQRVLRLTGGACDDG
jgi:16S rRNA (cytidine1402-2'-O)-methyltransferase